MHHIVTREKTDDGLIHFDIFSRLNEDRIIILDSEFNEETCSATVGQLKILANKSEDDIYMWINSPGGDCTGGLWVYDTMQTIPNTIHTIVGGEACSMGAFILSSGSKGKRFALPNSWIMIHQASAGARGNVQDMRITMNLVEKLNEQLLERMAVHCDKTVEEMKEAMARDKWLTPSEAKDFGLIDEIIQPMTNKWGPYKKTKSSPVKRTVKKK
jgi:ATP-dependent Clp protease protease subunit